MGGFIDGQHSYFLLLDKYIFINIYLQDTSIKAYYDNMPVHFQEYVKSCGFSKV